MAKALPVMGVLGAFLAACVVAVLVDTGILLVVPFTLVASVILLAQRTILGAVAGLVVLALTVLAALGMLGNVTTEEGGATDFGIGETAGTVLALAACLAIPVAAVAIRWDDAEPRWLAVGGLGAAALALAIALADPAALSDHGRVMTLVHAIVCLLALGPMVPLLSSAGAAPAELPPLAVVEAPVGKPAASRPPAAPQPPAKKSP